MNYSLNESFCEFYGVMIDDGCISRYVCQNKIHFEIRIEGNATTDLVYYKNYLKKLILSLFGRNPKIYFRKDCNGISVRFHSKDLALFLNEKLKFPFGKKGQIYIYKSLLRSWDKTRAVLRGLFDTDGSLYFTKNDYYKKRCYPIIEIVSISKKLLKQISLILVSKGFIIRTGHGGQSVKLHGGKNLKAWMNLIGTSHIDKLSKFLFWQKYGECPAIKELPLAERIKKLDRMDL